MRNTKNRHVRSEITAHDARRVPLRRLLRYPLVTRSQDRDPFSGPQRGASVACDTPCRTRPTPQPSTARDNRVAIVRDHTTPPSCTSPTPLTAGIATAWPSTPHPNHHSCVCPPPRPFTATTKRPDAHRTSRTASSPSGNHHAEPPPLTADQHAPVLVRRPAVSVGQRRQTAANVDLHQRAASPVPGHPRLPHAAVSSA